MVEHIDLLQLAARGLEVLTAVALIQQTAEYLALLRPVGPAGVWAFAVQRRDFAGWPAGIVALLGWLAREHVHHRHLILRLVAAVTMLLVGSSLMLTVILIISGFLLLLRWRGAFNGGSDFMTLVLMTGLLIANLASVLGDPVLGWHAGLLYVAIQSAASYFISGWVKILEADWRSGAALAPLLDDGIYGPLVPDSHFRRRQTALAASWAFLLWEAAVPLIFLDLRLAAVFCAVGIVFHILVYRYFGLNRFFWAWLATYPALLYAADFVAR